MDNGKMPAMPFEVVDETQSSRWWSGLTKREMMAISMMQGLISAWGQHDVTSADELASDAVMMADALLAELERTCQKT